MDSYSGNIKQYPTKKNFSALKAKLFFKKISENY